MNSFLYSHLSPRKITKIISSLVYSKLLFNKINEDLYEEDNEGPNFKDIDINKEYKGRRCRGKLTINIGPYGIGDNINIDVDKFNITIKSKIQNKSISYIVYPEMPTIKLLPENDYVWWPNYNDLKLFFELSNKKDWNFDEGVKSYKCNAVPRKNIGILEKGKMYIIEADYIASVYDLNNKFLGCIDMDYPMPLLIESNPQKL